MLSDKNIIVCSIVRDCAKNLNKNIKIIDKLCALVNDYSIVIFENDSKDDTKKILLEWEKRQKNIYISINDYNTGKTIPQKEIKSSINRFFSRSRIEKMASYRNKYLEVIKNNNLISDYIIVVDLDVDYINFNGVINSLENMNFWDAITANGYSISPRGSRRYHDTYALCEYGKQKEPQTEQKIRLNQYKWSFLKKGLPLIKVFSAFGGFAIYKYDAIMNSSYDVLKNDDLNVEVYCEHFALHKQMAENGFDEICINPSMIIKYQKISFKVIKNFILNKINL